MSEGFVPGEDAKQTSASRDRLQRFGASHGRSLQRQKVPRWNKSIFTIRLFFCISKVCPFFIRSYSRKAGKLNRRHRIYDRTQIELAIHLSKKVITPLPCLIRKVTAEHRKPQIVSKPQQPQARPDMTAERAPIPRISTNREISDFFMGPKDAIDEQVSANFKFTCLEFNLKQGGRPTGISKETPHFRKEVLK